MTALRPEPVEKTPAFTACAGCGSRHVEPFLELRDQPGLIGVQWASPEAARSCSKGDIRLVWCRDCGLIANAAFDPTIAAYNGAYDNSLAASPTYRAYARTTAERLVSEYDLRGKTAVEIGCGGGDFLELLCELGGNRGIGFDPGPRPRVKHNAGEARGVDADGGQCPPYGIRFINDFYSPKYADCVGDLICCRQVLEHIPQPLSFLQMLRKMIGSRRTVLHFDVPNAEYILSDLAVWTLIYEHPLYFTPFALWQLFESAGFAVRRLTEPFGRQFIQIDALPAEDLPPWKAEDKLTAELIALFKQAAEYKICYWRTQVAAFAARGLKVVAWGAGARGVAFFNILNIAGEVPYLVDLNTNKHGKYIAGTGQQIVGPEFLKSYRPDVVLVMNAIYTREICERVEQLGLEPRYFFP
jgi:SAM-dependent methyltransferase